MQPLFLKLCLLAVILLNMKRIVLSSLLVITLVSCSSVKKDNARLNVLHSQKQLQKDVDFAYKKLKRLHPDLYWYISKEKLDYKFDSLKTTINQPMTSMAFYKKLAPVVNEVRQGHMMVLPNTFQLTKEERKALIKRGVSPFLQIDLEMIDDKLYVIKNKSGDSLIQIGSEVVSINHKNTSDLLRNYEPLFTSDGFNTTYKKHRLAKGIGSFYSNENGIQDSVAYAFKWKDSIRKVWIKRKPAEKQTAATDSVANQKKARKKMTRAMKDSLIAANRHKSIYGYNPETKMYNRNLTFMESDSSVAVMRINSFSLGRYASFYEKSFEEIKNNNTKTLILDLRNNPGGRLKEIAELHSYLTDSTVVFADKSEVASKTSMLATEYFKGGGIVIKILKGIGYPIYLSYTLIKVKKNQEGKFLYATSESKPIPPKTNAFPGKVYVLINGGSFSASCILSSNLKGTKRAVFVGEETGGTYNGTVAGRMPLLKLPNSKLTIRYGLMKIAPFHKTDIEGRGIFPDVAIVPTLEDRINGIDPEMDWILEDIQNNATVVETVTIDTTE